MKRTHKTCKDCKETKPVDQFAGSAHKHKGRWRFCLRSQCTLCYNASQNRRLKFRKVAKSWLNANQSATG